MHWARPHRSLALDFELSVVFWSMKRQVTPEELKMMRTRLLTKRKRTKIQMTVLTGGRVGKGRKTCWSGESSSYQFHGFQNHYRDDVGGGEEDTVCHCLWLHVQTRPSSKPLICFLNSSEIVHNSTERSRLPQVVKMMT